MHKEFQVKKPTPSNIEWLQQRARLEYRKHKRPVEGGFPHWHCRLNGKNSRINCRLPLKVVRCGDLLPAGRLFSLYFEETMAI